MIDTAGAEPCEGCLLKVSIVGKGQQDKGESVILYLI